MGLRAPLCVAKCVLVSLGKLGGWLLYFSNLLLQSDRVTTGTVPPESHASDNERSLSLSGTGRFVT